MRCRRCPLWSLQNALWLSRRHLFKVQFLFQNVTAVTSPLFITFLQVESDKFAVKSCQLLCLILTHARTHAPTHTYTRTHAHIHTHARTHARAQTRTHTREFKTSKRPSLGSRCKNTELHISAKYFVRPENTLNDLP